MATLARRVDPGIFVLGMHRSGTSAATRLISLLGPALPPAHDLVPPSAKNPTGYWESLSLVAVNSRILEAVGSDFRWPQALDPGWERDPRLAPLRGDALRAFREVYPHAPWVWKDPRTCLTFGFWRDALPEPPVVVVVTRNPLEIAASAQRTGAVHRRGETMALWERYLRQALQQIDGLPVLVTSYSALVSAPLAWCRRVQDFFTRHGVPVREPPRAEVLGFADADLRHTTFTARDLDTAEDVSDAQRRLSDALDGLEGEHASFVPPPLPPETTGNEELFGERRRQFASRQAQLGQKRRAQRLTMAAKSLGRYVRRLP